MYSTYLFRVIFAIILLGVMVALCAVRLSKIYNKTQKVDVLLLISVVLCGIGIMLKLYWSL